MRRDDLRILALPLLVLLIAAVVASNRAVLSAGEIDLVRSAPVVVAPGHALPAVAAIAGIASETLLGGSALGVRTLPMAISLVLIGAVAGFCARRGSPAAAAWAALALLATGTFAQFIDTRLIVLPVTLLAVALVSADRIDASRLWPVVAFAVCAVTAVFLEAAYVFPVVAVCAATVLAGGKPRTAVAATVAVGLFSVAIAVNAAVSSEAGHDLFARFTSTKALLLQPVYALAFLQSAYGRALGLLVPAVLLLFGLGSVLGSRRPSEGRDVGAPEGARPRSEPGRSVAAVLLATLPVWAFAPAWILGRDITAIDLLPVSVGCCVLVGIAADSLAAARHRGSFVAGTTLLIVLAGASAVMRDPAVTMRRDLDQHRSRFVLLDWAQGLDSDLPIVVANRDVYTQLVHYGPAALAQRLAFLDTTSRDTKVAEAFVDEHPVFYLYEGSEIRSPLLAWLAHRGLTLSRSRSFVPRDQSIDAAAYLYRVDLD